MNIRHFGAILLITAACGGGEDPELPPQITVAPATLDFGVVGIESTKSAEFELSNAGGGEINLLSISLIEGDAGVWDLDRVETEVLGAQESIFVTALFNPVRQNDYVGRIQIRSDDENNSSLYVTLTGQGGPSTEDGDSDGYSEADGDCDDSDGNRYPGAFEDCDGVDNNCDGVVPTQESDSDYDGYRLCATDSREVDCNDSNALIYPGAPEVCDGEDSDCDGNNSDDADGDGDGQSICSGCENQGSGTPCGDCDDTDDEIAQGLEEICDGKDNDCDGNVDNQDADGDGFSLCDTGGDCDDNDAEKHPLVVDDDGSGVNSNGTAASPFTNLGPAIAAFDGDSDCPIYVLNGSYSGPFVVESDQVIYIKGQSREGAKLSGDESTVIFDVRSSSSLFLENLTLEDGWNDSKDGGAISGGTQASLTLTHVDLVNNGTATDGGAISVVGGDLHLEDVLLSNNLATDDGGAIAATGSTLVLTNSEVIGNSATFGGAIFAVSGTELQASDVLFQDNAARDSGGAVWLESSTSCALVRSRFYSNSAVDSGGGVVLADVDDADGQFSNNLLQDNTAQGNGGGLVISGNSNASRLKITNNTFTSNVAQGGDVSDGTGANLLIRAASQQLEIQSNIFAWAKGADNVHSTSSVAIVAYNTVFNTTSGLEFAGSLSSLDLSIGESDANENFNDNPLFTTFADDGIPGDDLRLRNDSPCIDSGPDDESWLDSDGTRNNRGAYGGCLSLDGSGDLEQCGAQ